VLSVVIRKLRIWAILLLLVCLLFFSSLLYHASLLIFLVFAPFSTSSLSDNLGRLIETGRGVPKSLEKAFNLYLKAQDNREAQYAIGYYYEVRSVVRVLLLLLSFPIPPPVPFSFLFSCVAWLGGASRSRTCQRMVQKGVRSGPRTGLKVEARQPSFHRIMSNKSITVRN
jgi:hypothetical protein